MSRGLQAFVALARSLDDGALAALGNRGLLRRARKDLDKATPVVGAVDGDELPVTLDSETVHLGLQPSASRCTCPATGACRHILGAWCHLATLESTADDGETTTVDAVTEILAIDDAQLRRYAGGALLRRATQELAAGARVEFDAGPPTRLRLPDWGAEVRWLPGGDLASSLCSCHAVEACLHRIVAVLGLQVERGARRLDLEHSSPKASSEAPRSRAELLAATAAALVEVIEPGLCRLSVAAVQRFRTLGTSAHGVDLPRLQRVLRGFAGDLDALRQRDGGASAEVIALRAARLEALRVGLETPRPGLVGRHRGRFARVGDLSLVGMGARVFTTPSGFHGLVCYFFEPATGGFNTWGESRRVGTDAGFDPVQRFTAPGPWSGCPNPAEASSHAIRLSGAWRSGAGRLSGREGVRYMRTGPTDAESVPAITAWSELAEVCRRALGGGLADADELAGLVHLRPEAWRPEGFDAVAQRWVAVVEDADGRPLQLVVPFSTEHAAAIEHLERCRLDSFASLLGYLTIDGGQLVVLPITLFGPGQVLSITLAAPATKTLHAAENLDPADDEAGELAPPEPHFEPAAGSLAGVCEQLQQELVDYTERGTRTRPRNQILALARALGRDGGLASLQHAVEQLDAAPSASTRARRLLRCLFVSDAVIRSLSIEHALAD